MTKGTKVSLWTVMISFMCIFLSGCTSGAGTSNGSEMGGINSATTELVTDANVRYNATDLAIVTNIDTKKSEITFKGIDSNIVYTLTYTGGTRIRSKNGVELLISQVLVGEIVDVYYVQGSQKLIEMQESSKAWENTSVVKWNVDYNLKKITIGSSTYKYDDDIFITSAGHGIAINEISGVDELIVKGVDNKVLSVVVEKGHGFVRLVDDTNMIGGMIEIGTNIMTVITDDMVIVAPEGTHTLTATKNGKGGSKEITVSRDEEIIVSLSEFQAEATRYGIVNFTVLPDDAEALMYIDGVKRDYSDILELSYGSHTLILTSNNYDTYQKTITVASSYTNIKIDMSGASTEETTDSSEETTTKGAYSTEEETTVSTGTGTYTNTIYIVAPANANVYFDGIYKGTAPLSFTKSSGTHTIVLMKTGYETKVYTVYLDEGNEDVILSYPSMTENDE